MQEEQKEKNRMRSAPALMHSANGRPKTGWNKPFSYNPTRTPNKRRLFRNLKPFVL